MSLAPKALGDGHEDTEGTAGLRRNFADLLEHLATAQSHPEHQCFHRTSSRPTYLNAEYPPIKTPVAPPIMAPKPHIHFFVSDVKVLVLFANQTFLHVPMTKPIFSFCQQEGP